MIEALASGRWLTERRIVMVARLMLLMTVVVIGYLFATAHGTLDYLGRPIGTDFSDVYAAGRLANDHRAVVAWDWPTHYAMQQLVHHDVKVPFYGWHYPPPFLLVASLLARLPYLPALVVWQVATLVPAILLVRKIVPGKYGVSLTLAAPVVLVCLMHGHNGFLTAALFGGGLLVLDRRPLLAGLMFGCLIYKPQFALVLPLVLVVGGHWRAIIGSLTSATLIVAATVSIWGPSVWVAFVRSLPLTRRVVIEEGNTGWEKIQTAFSAVRSWGASIEFAYAIQGVVTCVVVTGAAVATRRSSPRVRSAAILSAALMSTPYALDYDYTLLGVAIVFLVAEGQRTSFRPWEITILSIAWVTPLVARSVATTTLIPLGLVSALTVWGLTMRRTTEVLTGPAVRSRCISILEPA